MAEIDIGMGKSARRAYSLDELVLLPGRRTRDADLVDLSTEAFQFYRELNRLRRKWLFIMVGIGMKFRRHAGFEQHQLDGKVVFGE